MIELQESTGGRSVQIQIDGGIKEHNIATVGEWGVSNCVVGSGLFNDNATVKENLQTLHTALEV